MTHNLPPPPSDRKIDRRIQRTRLALRKAFVELVAEKGFDSISVEEITQRADTGRATFYLHYKDKDDILLDEFSEKVNEQVRLISQVPITLWDPHRVIGGEEGVIVPLRMAFQHAAENADFYRVILRGESSKRIAGRINEIIVQSYQEVFEARFPDSPHLIYQQIPIELIAVYFSGALLSCVSWWLEQDPLPSPDLMSKIFQALFIPGVKQIFASNQPK